LKIDYEQIVKKCLENDQASQRALYKALLGKLMGVCRRYTRNKQEAEDCLQEAFIKIFTSLPNFKADGPFEAWTRRIAVNESLQFLRKNKKFDFMDDVEIYHNVPDFSSNAISMMNHDELLMLLNDLPQGKKVVFNLFVIEGYSHKEIGVMLNISENTSKSQLSKAKDLLVGMVEKLNLN